MAVCIFNCLVISGSANPKRSIISAVISDLLAGDNCATLLPAAINQDGLREAQAHFDPVDAAPMSLPARVVCDHRVEPRSRASPWTPTSLNGSLVSPILGRFGERGPRVFMVDAVAGSEGLHR
jgi:hypothetical protein